MSHSNDSEEVTLQNGDHASHEVEEKEDSNGHISPEISINQEPEPPEPEPEPEPAPAPEPEAGAEQIRHAESKEDMFVDATDDMQDNQSLEMDNGSAQDDSPLADKYTVTEDYKDETEGLRREVAILRQQLRDLTSKQTLSGDSDKVQEEIVGDASLSEMMSECFQLVKVSLEERLQTETMIRDLQLQIEAFNGKVQMEQNIEVMADRMLGSLSMVINQEELLDYSVMGKIAHVERNTYLLVEQYRWFLYEVDQLRQCLVEGGFNVGLQEEFGYGSVFSVARDELLELKKREAEVLEKINHLEDMNGKLIGELEKEKAMVETTNSEIEKVKVELDQEKNRCANTKEKLSMAVTKGKALVQQRDSLRQSLAEKTSELEKCLIELQEKSSVAETADLCKVELARSEHLVASLQETLSNRNVVLERCEEVFSEANVPEELQSMDISERLKWLVNLVASLQETLSENNAIFENFEAIFSQTSVFKEIESMDMMERLKWLLKLVASLQEMLSQRNRILDSLEENLSQVNAPVEVSSLGTLEKFKWIVEERNALKDNLVEFHKFKDALSLVDLPETATSSDLETRIGWLKESINQAKGEINMLQDEIVRTKEAAHNEIDRLTAALLAESQEKEYIKMEMDALACKLEGVAKEAHQASSEKEQMVKLLLEGSGITESYSDVAELIERCFGKLKEQSVASFGISPADAEVFERIQNLLYVRDQELTLSEKLLEEDMLVRSEVSNLSNELRVASAELAALKEEKNSLQKDLQRSEEKSALLREKLSLAVKKGKGLVQDRENLKLSLDEKNSEIEKLKIELHKQESMVSEYRDQINRLSTDLEQIPKLEAELIDIKNQRDQLEQFLLESNNMLQRVIESVDQIVLPVNSVFKEPVEKVNWLAGYMNECQKSMSQAEEELDIVKENSTILASKLVDAQQTIKSLEDALSIADSRITQLKEEQREIEAAKESAEQDLQKSKDEAHAQTSKFAEAWASIQSLEDALSLAENNISLVIKEREEAQLSKAAAETELERVREEVAVQTGKLTEAYRTIKSLEDALSVAEANVSSLTEQNNHLQVGRTNLEYELKELKEEAESQASKLADASTTMRYLEDALSKAENDISVLKGEKRIAEQEISTLDSKLKACMDELAISSGSLENRSAELIHHFSDLQMHMRNESLLPIVRQHFEKEFENLRNMDIILRDIKKHLVNTGLELWPGYPIMEEDLHAKLFPDGLGNIENIEMVSDKVNVADVNNISLYFKKTVEGFQSRNAVLMDNFEGFSASIGEFIEALFGKLRATVDAVTIISERMESMKQKINSMEMHKEEQEKTIAVLEKDCRVLLSACSNATSKLQFEVKNNLLELSSIPELERLRRNMNLEVTELDSNDVVQPQIFEDNQYEKVAENLLLVTRKVRTLTELFESTSKVAAATIEDLQKKLTESRAAYDKAVEERDLIQSRVSELEIDVEALQNSCRELKLKAADYQAIEEKLKEKEAELSNLHSDLLMKEQVAEEALMSASELKTLFDKIRSVETSFAKLEVEDVELHSSVDVQKLFYIIDSVPELHRQINVLSHEKGELLSTASMQLVEIEHLKEENGALITSKQECEKMKKEMSEITSVLEKIIDTLGGSEIVADQKIAGDQNSFGVQRLLSVVEKQIMTLLWEVNNSKSQVQELDTRLLGSQKVIEELSTKLKLLEDSFRSKTVQPEIVQERSIFEAPPLPSGSEISEIEDVGGVGSNAISPVTSAAQLRTMRKGSTDHLVLSIDSESSSLINNEETDEDKGHVFKSLNTSGLVPKQGKSLADRIDGIWVSGGRVLMSRPRARLGLIAYWLFLHLWLLGTIL